MLWQQWADFIYHNSVIAVVFGLLLVVVIRGPALNPDRFCWLTNRNGVCYSHLYCIIETSLKCPLLVWRIYNIKKLIKIIWEQINKYIRLAVELILVISP